MKNKRDGHRNLNNFNSRRNLYMPLEDLDWRVWDEDELIAFRYMYESGRSIEQMAKYFNCKDLDLINIMIIDQARKGKISPKR